MRRDRWPTSARKSDNYSSGGWRTAVGQRAFFTVPGYPRLGFETISSRPMRISEYKLPARALGTALLVPFLFAACRTVERGAGAVRPEADRIRRDIAYLADDRLD